MLREMGAQEVMPKLNDEFCNEKTWEVLAERWRFL